MLENSHVRHSILAVFCLYGMVIRPPVIFLLHISGSSDFFFFISSASPVLLLSVSELVHLCAPTFLFAHLAL